MPVMQLCLHNGNLRAPPPNANYNPKKPGLIKGLLTIIVSSYPPLRPYFPGVLVGIVSVGPPELPMISVAPLLATVAFLHSEN